MRPEAINELKEAFNNCKELYDMAWGYNQYDCTRNPLSQKTTTYMPQILQIMAYILQNNTVEENE